MRDFAGATASLPAPALSSSSARRAAASHGTYTYRMLSGKEYYRIMLDY